MESNHQLRLETFWFEEGSATGNMDRQATLGATREGGAKKSKRKNFDWISEPRTLELTPFQQFTVDIDWEKSPLGPMNGWSKQLRAMVLLCFADPSPVSFFFIYNF